MPLHNASSLALSYHCIIIQNHFVGGRLTDQWVAAGDSAVELLPAIKVALVALPAANLATLKIVIETCYRKCWR